MHNPLRRLILVLCFLLLSLTSLTSLNARGRYNGVAAQSGTIVTGGVPSTTTAYRTFPSATITVYAAGTTTLSSIYSDNNGTVKANPFTAPADATIQFYADDGRYDVRIAPTGGTPVPFTIGDMLIKDGTVYDYNVKAYGAACNWNYTTGTDDTAAVLATIAAAPSGGKVIITNKCLVGTTTPNSQALLITKNITLESSGFPNGLYISTTTPTSSDGVVYRPSTSPENQGFRVKDMTIMSAGCSPLTGTITCANYSSRHMLVIDSSLGVSNVTPRGVTVSNCWLVANFAGGAAAGNLAMYATGGNFNGTPTQSLLENSYFYNGINFANGGDSIAVRDSEFYVYNGLQISGVSSTIVEHCNITSRKGVHLLGVNVAFNHNTLEMVESDTVGYDSAMIEIENTFSLEMHNNFYLNQTTSPFLDGIKLKSVTSADIRNNFISIQAGFNAINVTNVVSDQVIEVGPNVFNGSATITAADLTRVKFPVYRNLNGDVLLLARDAVTAAPLKAASIVASNTYGDIAPTNGAFIKGPLAQGVGGTITAAATIAPTNSIHHVTGATPISTITVPTNFPSGCIKFVPDTAYTTNTAGNIGIASTAIVGQVMEMCWDSVKWFPSY